MKNFNTFICYLKEEERSENTISAYIYGLRVYFNKYNKLTKSNLIKWKDWMKVKYKPRTVNHRIVLMNQYLRFVGLEKLQLKRIKTQSLPYIENVICLDDYNKLLNCLKFDKNIKGYYMVRLLAETGVRVSELLKLKIEHLETGIAEIHTKASKVRMVYIRKKLADDLKQYLNNQERFTGFIILNRFGEQMTSRGVSQKLQNYAIKYGIDKKVMHPHSFRHFFAIQFLEREQNLSLLADLMGHSNISTTAIYTRLSQSEQIKKLNEVVNW